MDLELKKNLIQRVAVGDMFRRRAIKTPDKIAIRDYKGLVEVSYTCKELNQKINCFASAAKKSGLGKESRVAILGFNSSEYIIALYGCAKAGITAVPVNPGISPEDIIFVLNHSETACLVVDSLLIPLIDKIRDHLPGIHKLVYIETGDEAVSQEYTLFEDFLAKGLPDEVEDVIIQDRDIFEILYTSGTTGKPKGVLISHLGVYIAALSTAIAFGLKPGSSATTILPIFHCAQQAVTYSALNVGGSVSIFRQFDPGHILKTVEKDQLNMIFALPIMFRAMMGHPDALTRNWSHLETCVFGMAPMDQGTIKQGMEIFGAQFMLGTGQTECFPATNVFEASQHLDKSGNYWGVSNVALDTCVMDENGNILPPGEVGEIVWRGPAVMEGYYKDEEATMESRKFGWHHSGDLGSFDEDGQLLFVDRKKDMIKTGGENVASIKVELAILSDHRVDQVAVVGLPDERWIEAVTAFVIPFKDSQITEQDIIQLCKKELGKFEVPKKVIFMDNLPVTSTGKVRKNILRETGGKAYH